MIPAKIISIDDKVMVEWPPEPDKHSFFTILGRFDSIFYESAIKRYKLERTIAEVENVRIVCRPFSSANDWFLKGAQAPISRPHVYRRNRLSLNQTVFIEPIENNKVKIVKI